MARKNKSDDDAPKGGWLGPPPSDLLTPLYVGVGKHRKPVKQTAKDKKKRKKFEKQMKKADKKGVWRWK